MNLRSQNHLGNTIAVGSEFAALIQVDKAYDRYLL